MRRRRRGGVNWTLTKGLERMGWIPPELRYDHPERRRLRESPMRFKWVAAGRRSGKTIDAIDHILLGHGPIDPVTGLYKFRGALTVDATVEDPTFVVGGPTYGMLAKIWWDKLIRRIPPNLIDSANVDMQIRFITGAKLYCIGLDSATRAEGIAIDGLVVDEFAYIKELAWKRSLRPALGTRGRPPGWAILQGKPAGRNHFYKGWKRAKDGLAKQHDAFHWKSSVVMSELEVAQARVDLDPASFRQEYEASFESYTGLAYYTFGPHNYRDCTFDPRRPIAFAWDFGTSPGTVAVVQVQDIPATHCVHCGDPRPFSALAGESWHCRVCHEVAYDLLPCVVVLDEAYQLMGSTTRALCQELVVKWADKLPRHSRVMLYGDPAGYAADTRSRSSDWDEIVKILARHFPNVTLNVPHQQPPQRDRINSLLRMCQSDAGLVRLFVDKDKAPHTWDDFENTVLKENGSGEINKAAAGGLYSHLTDAIAYLTLKEFPVRSGEIVTEVVGT